MKHFYITTPIYYVNDVPHLGHAYTTVAADVLARYYRLKGSHVRFLTGTDEHGQKNAESAAKAGLTPQEYVDQRSADFKKTFEELGIEFRKHNIFMRTTDPKHHASVDVFMKKLDQAGALYEGDYEGLYCQGCEDFKTEKELIDGLCSIHKSKPELLKEKNWFFKLSDYKGRVRKLIESGKMTVEPEARQNEVLGMLDDLPDFSVTRQRVEWGVPFFKDPSQIVYVWVEALQNYISALGYPEGEDFENFWPADVHLMAKDIIKFHAIFWPAMLLAAGLDTPKKIFAHGFFTLNGQKMSKTLGNVIHPHELVEKYGSDATRYLLLSQFPFGQDGDIQENRLVEKYNADLANGLGNLVSRTIALCEQNFQGKVPSCEISETGRGIKVAGRIPDLELTNKIQVESQGIQFASIELTIQSAWRIFEEALENLRLYDFLEFLFGRREEEKKKERITGEVTEVYIEKYRAGLIPFLNLYLNTTQVWEMAKSDKANAGLILYNILESCYHIAQIINPFMPDISKKLIEQLGKPKPVGFSKEWGSLVPGAELGKREPLFPRIDQTQA